MPGDPLRISPSSTAIPSCRRDYFERLLAEFGRDPGWGLRVGCTPTPPRLSGDSWKVVPIPVEHHVPGTLKCYSLACFQAIGGIQERLGWDTIDETYARM